MLERILTMHSPLQKVEQAEELQQQVWGRGQTDQGERFLYVTYLCTGEYSNFDHRDRT